jgi:hypothetical protein
MADGIADKQGRKALIVANERVGGEQLRSALLEQLEQGISSVFVVAPALAGSALKHQMGDIDDAIEPAAERLRETLDQLREAGLEADGEVGDSDPIQAISDEIQKFHPDQILIVGHRDEDGAFAERGLLEQAQRDIELPVTELFVEPGDSRPRLLDVERTEAGAGRGEGWRPSANLPPLTRRNVAGIFVAIVGTLLLGFLAAECFGADVSGAGDNEEGRTDWVCAVRALIALAFALINLAHVVGLLLFQSVRYEGIFSRFFARLSLYGTPLAVLVSLALGLF